jgi:hypothetical protein
VPYILIAVLLTGFGAGYALSYQLSQAALSNLQTGIDNANETAGLVLDDSRKRVAIAKDKAKADLCAMDKTMLLSFVGANCGILPLKEHR